MKARKIFHPVIGEDIFVMDQPCRPIDLPKNVTPLYSAQEVAVLKKNQFSEEALKTINSIKKAFNGHIVSIRKTKQ